MRTLCAFVLLFASLLPAAPASHPDSAADRVAFGRWFTFLAESRYYAHKRVREIQDCAGLVAWAFRLALVPHDAAWARKVELPVYPAMPSVQLSWTPPRTQPAPADGTPDEPILRRYNAALVSRDMADAEPGDLLVYRDFQRPSHIMIYIGASKIVPSRRQWVVYYDPSSGIHRVSIDDLHAEASPEWWPVAANPDFLGVWRMEILRGSS